MLEIEYQFFCDVFDMSTGYRPNFNVAGYWLYKDNKPLIHLTESSNDVEAPFNNVINHIAFRLTDGEAILSKLAQKDIKFTLTQIEELEMTQVFFKSPAGVGLEVNFLKASD